MKQRILVVDDTADTLGLVLFDLRDAYDAQGSASAADAIYRYDAARAAGQPFNAVILDIGMAGQSGHQVSKHIRAVGDWDTKIIFHTGFNREMNRQEAEDVKAAAFWVKPLTGGKMREMLAEVLNGA